MKFIGTFKQKYSVDKEAKELVVIVKLLLREGMIEAGKNLYYGTVTVNEREIQHEDSPTCVNAQYLAEKVGNEVINSWKARAKKESKVFKLIK